MKNRKGQLFATFSIILIILIAFALISSYKKDVNYPKKEKIKDKNIFIELTGFSMYPVLEEGEIKSCKAQENYSKGDVIAFDKNGKTISHRIIGKVNGDFITKGDNNLIPDLFLVNEDEVICKVIF